VTSDHAQVEYKCTELYAPEDEITVAWWDAAIGIAWPLEHPRTSAKDALGKPVAELEGDFPRYQRPEHPGG
jgi:dTDP-4-dehydrorhamnose 3,5-epimerase